MHSMRTLEKTTPWSGGGPGTFEKPYATTFSEVKPVFEIPDDDLIGEVILPAMEDADILRISAGFFSSRCLAQIAPGLATFINNTNTTLDLLISPDINQADREAILSSSQEPVSVLEKTLVDMIKKARLSENAIVNHTLTVLSYLVGAERIRIRLVLMKEGMYHKKIWLFCSDNQWLAVHGSGNATERGLLLNGEQMSIDRSWQDGPQSEKRVQILLEQWNRQWHNRHPDSLTVEATQALEVLRNYDFDTPPTEMDFWEAWQHDYEAGVEPVLPPDFVGSSFVNKLRIPNEIIWREGRYSHQEQAVDAILRRDGGIISVATGGGKTLIALIAATKIQDKKERHLCIVILVPTRPLIKHWVSDVRKFGIEPVVLSGKDKMSRQKEFERVVLGFRTTVPKTEVLIMSTSLFTRKSSPERQRLESMTEVVEILLIADEVHNLGAPSFINNPPSLFDHRIGLSATPIRQYDPDGTDNLFEFFGGPPVFDFTLEDGIKSGCLVPYNYQIHPVVLESEEMEYYIDLTEQLAHGGFRLEDDGVTIGLTSRAEALLRNRRALIEQANAKLPALELCLKNIGTESITRTLIYTSAKNQVLGKPKQILEVNLILERLHIISHQLTNKETSTPESDKILSRFGAGEYQVLTAMKVLDEGVDIPQTDTAFLLASTTVQREWVQRRGRILRRIAGKRMSNLHDFLVLPPEPNFDTKIGKSLIRSELKRIYEFTRLAENEYDEDGPNIIIRNIEKQIGR